MLDPEPSYIFGDNYQIIMIDIENYDTNQYLATFLVNDAFRNEYIGTKENQIVKLLVNLNIVGLNDSNVEPELEVSYKSLIYPIVSKKKNGNMTVETKNLKKELSDANNRFISNMLFSVIMSSSIEHSEDDFNEGMNPKKLVC